MKAGELLDLWRREVDDVQEPYLWSDDEGLEYADDAQNEACRRARLIVDSTTTSTCSITTVVGTATYALSPLVLRVNRVRVAGESLPLGAYMVRDMDRVSPGWEDDTQTSTPITWIPDFESGKIRVYPAPNAITTLKLQVVRLPINALTSKDVALEIRAEYQKSLRHWMVYRGFLKRDTETYNEKAAAAALALFEREFGKPQPAIDETWANQNHTGDSWDGRF